MSQLPSQKKKKRGRIHAGTQAEWRLTSTTRHQEFSSTYRDTTLSTTLARLPQVSVLPSVTYFPLRKNKDKTATDFPTTHIVKSSHCARGGKSEKVLSAVVACFGSLTWDKVRNR